MGDSHPLITAFQSTVHHPRSRRGHGRHWSPPPLLPLWLSAATQRYETQALPAPPSMARTPPPAFRCSLRVIAQAAAGVARPPAPPVPVRRGKVAVFVEIWLR
jgi:hypothetical protein